MNYGLESLASPSIDIGSRDAVTDLQRNLVERVGVGDIAARAADAYGDRPAIIDGGDVMGFRELNEQAKRLGHALLGLGLKHQDVVAVMARKRTALLRADFVCGKSG